MSVQEREGKRDLPFLSYTVSAPQVIDGRQTLLKTKYDKVSDAIAAVLFAIDSGAERVSIDGISFEWN